MRILLDTNIVLRLGDKGHVMHGEALAAIDWLDANDVKGKNAHDARLVAAMQRHGLTDFLSFNKLDFTRFTAINTFTPAEVLDGQVPS